MASVPEVPAESSRKFERSDGRASQGSRARRVSEQITDPLRAVLELGRRQARTGMIFGLAGALFLHGGVTGRALLSMVDAAGFAASVQKRVLEHLRATYDIDAEPPPPPPPPPPPEPEPEPEKAQPPPPPGEPPPPPPAAAQAGKVLTAEPDPNEPVDLTDQGFVSGDADRYAGGTTATKGTEKKAVHNANAVSTGVPGGTGKKPAPPPPAKDLSRPASPTSTSWNCGFPPEADMEQINSAVVTLIVTVEADGAAKSVQVARDPGYGFGNWARQCALRKRYNIGYDHFGKPVTKTTPPFTVRFNR